MNSDMKRSQVIDKVREILSDNPEDVRENVVTIVGEILDNQAKNELDKEAENNVKNHVDKKTFIVSDFEDFLMELHDLTKSIQILSDLLDVRSEIIAEDLAPIFRVFDNNFCNCYNRFSKFGSILYNTPLLELPCRTKWLSEKLNIQY